MFEYFLQNLFLVFILEIGAAVSGSIYLKKISDHPPGARLMVFYLWLVVFVEIVGLYAAYAYFSDYTKLGFIEGTPFERNYWWFNIYHVVKIIILSYFFIRQYGSLQKQKLFYVLTWIITISFIFDIFLSDIFFTQYQFYSTVAGALYLIVLILIYYIELMESNRILNFYNSFVFYISIGMLVWHAMVTPLFIYSKYYRQTSPEFVALYSIILQLANVFLYGVIILGFWVCKRKWEDAGRNYSA